MIANVILISMDPHYDALYLSPHLDDAALSCGGQIFRQTQRGDRVLVVTVAAGEPTTEIRSIFAQFQHHNWGLSAAEAVSRRRAEDQAACRLLGADVVHWTLPDAIYRLDPQSEAPLYTSNDDIFGPLDPSEGPLITAVADFFFSLPRARRVVAPLTVGNHVDHQLTRSAAERVWGASLLYYEDYPYVQRDPRALEQLLQPRDQWCSYLVTLSQAALAARLKAIRAYVSQMRSLFNTVEQMEVDVRQQVARTGGERLWQRRIPESGRHQ